MFVDHRPSLFDRVLWTCVVLIILAGVLPFAVGAIVTVAAVLTVCFLLVRLVIYFTTDRW